MADEQKKTSPDKPDWLRQGHLWLKEHSKELFRYIPIADLKRKRGKDE